MKKLFLMLAMLVSIQAQATGPSLPGQDGGGGDGVIKNGEVELRDLYGSELKPVEDNILFLRDIKGFPELMYKLSLAYPQFAVDIFANLIKTTIYLSPKKLPTLPYQLTTIVGVPAGVQLAARYGNDIILSPTAVKLNNKKDGKKLGYLMIHEALHGLLPNNFGPGHHQRVRAIIRYLSENENNLTADGLKAVMPKNWEVKQNDIVKIALNKNLPKELRCGFVNDASYNYRNTAPDLLRFGGVDDCKDSKGKDSYSSYDVLDELFPSNVKIRSLGRKADQVWLHKDSVVLIHLLSNVDHFGVSDSNKKTICSELASFGDDLFAARNKIYDALAELTVLYQELKAELEDPSIHVDVKKLAIERFKLMPSSSGQFDHYSLFSFVRFFKLKAKHFSEKIKSVQVRRKIYCEK